MSPIRSLRLPRLGAIRARPITPDPLLGAAYLMQRVTPVGSPMKLHRLLFLAQVIHFGRHGTAIFPDRFRASVCGPALPGLQSFQRNASRAISRRHSDALSETARSVIVEVGQGFGHLPEARLVQLTHKRHGAWAKHFVPETATSEALAGEEIPLASLSLDYLYPPISSSRTEAGAVTSEHAAVDLRPQLEEAVTLLTLLLGQRLCGEVDGTPDETEAHLRPSFGVVKRARAFTVRMGREGF